MGPGPLPTEFDLFLARARGRIITTTQETSHSDINAALPTQFVPSLPQTHQQAEAVQGI